MSGFLHKLFIFILMLIVAITFVFLLHKGLSYYQTSMEERYFHPQNEILKPSGFWGHGLGIVGSFLMIFGMVMYISRKRIKAISRWGSLKHWLEVHIFLCTLGPLMILFHTSFKFGGIVAVSFWSMVAVWLSGVIGRFIYVQIPRTIEGRELSLSEVRDLRTDMDEILKNNYNLDGETSEVILAAINLHTNIDGKNPSGNYIKRYFDDFKTIRTVKNILDKHNLYKGERKKIVELVKKDLSLNRKIGRLVTMQKLFNYWHVAHLPFAVIMIIIMIIHVIVTITFGYKWIF